MDAKLRRFCEICVEVEVDPKKLMESGIPLLPSIAQRWNNGQMSDVQLMRCIRNLGVVNPKISINSEARS